MNNALTTMPSIDQVPDYLRGAAGGALTGDALSGGVALGFPILSVKGKTWKSIIDGDANIILNSEGEPRASVSAVIVGANGAVSKTYYPGAFVEGADDAPTCYSNDGVQPATDVPSRQAPLCAGCPHNQWGSVITENGKKGKACADSRRLAVVIGDFDKPHLLRVPATSLKGLAEYGKMLAVRQLPVHGVMTKISFDSALAYPRLIFEFRDFLQPDQFAASVKCTEHVTMDAILYGNAAPAPTPPAQTAASAPTLTPEPVQTAAVAVPEPAAAAAPDKKPRAPRAPRAAAPAAEPVPQEAEPIVEQVQAQDPAAQTTQSPALTKAAELLGGLLGAFDDD